LNSNVLGPALTKLKEFISGAAETMGAAVEQTGRFFTKIDFLNLYSGKADKAKVAHKDAQDELKKAEENLARYEARMAKEGADKRDFLGDNTLAEDVAAAKKRLNDARYAERVKGERFQKLQREAEAEAEKEAERRNLGSVDRPQYAGDPASGDHIVTSQMGNRSLALSPGMHMGVDIATAVGEKLVAFTNGRVEATGYDGGYGNWVNWIANDGYGNFYGHMDKPAFVKAGDKVKKGDVLGLTGNTGRSSGPHLHWEVAKNPADTGRSKANVLSRVNPLGRYHKEHPFGGGPSIAPVQLGHGGKGGSRSSVATAVSSLNNSRTQEISSRSVDEARQALVGRARSKPVVILQPIVKPIVQQVATQPQFAAPSSPTNIA
jgi:murein DD-endopeptidase MepM/ murein hydrolase activator NlpD